jgi:hypothetical protein
MNRGEGRAAAFCMEGNLAAFVELIAAVAQNAFPAVD